MEAQRLGAPGGTIAVVDAGGHLLALERLDGTFPASADIAIAKARAAAMFRKPTKALEDTVNGGRTAMVTLPDFTLLQGGEPIVADGQVVGAVGVSGAASADQDTQLAVFGAKSIAMMSAEPMQRTSMPADTPRFFDHHDVMAAFAKGMPILETAGYKVHASRRERPGMAEVHDDETDIIYVVEGTAMLVTGGTVVDPQRPEAGQLRGSSIEGGTAQRLQPGDVVIVPQGVPHWFSEVNGPFLYFVVKPIAPHGAN
jgi:glc operon protein GlcG